MASFRSFPLILAAAVVSRLVYPRLEVLFTFYNDAPSRLPQVNTFKRHEIKFADRVRSCEDALILESRGVAILACDPGRERWNTVLGIFHPDPASAGLYVYDYRDASLPEAESLKTVELVGFPGRADFHTLGLAYDEATSTLFAASHAQAGSRIERFKLDVDRLVATHTGTIQHPLIHAPNSIAIVSPDELYVTNDHHFLARNTKLLAKAETFLALPLGSVVHVKLLDGDRTPQVGDVRIVERLSFPNGIELLNDTTLAVASTTRRAIYLYEIQRDRSLEPRSTIHLPYLPDNLSVHGGKLLVAGHPHFPSLAKFSESRHVCNYPEVLGAAGADKREYCESGLAPSWAGEWSEHAGLRILYVGTEYPTSATAARDARRGVGIITGLYAKGILVWRD